MRCISSHHPMHAPTHAPLRRPAVPYLQVVIQDGQVLAGTLCKKTLGAAPGGLVHITWMEFGPEAARALLSQVGCHGLPSSRATHVGWICSPRQPLACCCFTGPFSLDLLFPNSRPLLPPSVPLLISTRPQIQFTVNHWLLQHGFSIGIGDLIADPRTMAIINDIMEKAKQDVKKLIEKVQVGGRGGQWRFHPLAWCVCENELSRQPHKQAALLVCGGHLDEQLLGCAAGCTEGCTPCLPLPPCADQRPGAAAGAHHHGVV